MRSRDVEIRDVELIRHRAGYAELVAPPSQRDAVRPDDPHASPRVARLPREEMKHLCARRVGFRRDGTCHGVGARLQLRLDLADLAAHTRHLTIDVRKRTLPEAAADSR